MKDPKLAWMADGYKYPGNRPSSHPRVTVKGNEDLTLYCGTKGHGDRSKYSSPPQQRQTQSAISARVTKSEESYYTGNEHIRRGFGQRGDTRPNSAQPRLNNGIPKSPHYRPGRATHQRARRTKSATPMANTVNHTYQASRLIANNGFLLSETEYLYQKAAQAAPDHHYPDRHSRCHHEGHIHNHLLLARPRKMCQKFGPGCPSRNLAHRPGKSPAPSEVSEDDLDLYTEREVRYMQALRPRTAPITKRDFQVLPRHNGVLRGTTPHFCNFASKVQLHERDRINSSTGGVGGDASRRQPRMAFMEDALGDAANQQNSLSNDGLKSRPASPSSVSKDGSEEDRTASIGVEFISKKDGRGIEEASKALEGEKEEEKKEVILSGPIVDAGPPSKPPTAWDDKNYIQIKMKTKKSTKKKKASVQKDIEASSGADSVIKPTPKSLTDTQSNLRSEEEEEEEERRRRIRRGCVKKERKGPVRRPQAARRGEFQAPEPDVEQFDIEVPVQPAEDTPESDDSPREKPSISIPDLPEYKPKTSERKVPSRSTAKPRNTNMSTKAEPQKTEPEKNEEKQNIKPFEFPSDLPSSEDQQAKAHIEKVEPQIPQKEEEPEEDEDWDKMMSPVGRDPLEILASLHRGQETDHVKIITENPQQKPKAQSWAQARLALSQQACRFELPMDMRILEKLTPQEYLRDYCVFSSRRQSLYQKVFLKHKDKQGYLTMRHLGNALTDVLIHTITQEQIKSMVELVQLNDESHVDLKLFCGMAALSERILYPEYLTEDTSDIQEHKREKIESADFCALEWKFHGVNVNPPVRKILEAL